MRTVEALHRTKERTVRLRCGPNYRPAPRRPVRRPHAARERLSVSAATLLPLALTAAARAITDARPELLPVVVEALTRTELGHARAIVLVDGAVACRWR